MSELNREVNVPRLFSSMAVARPIIVQYIDEKLGGWPVRANFLIRIHGADGAYFAEKENPRTESYSTMLTADDYYFAKLSEKQKNVLRNEGYVAATKQLTKHNPFEI